MDKKKIKIAIYVIIGLIALYLLYELYLNYENSNSSTTANTAANTNTTSSINTSSNYNGYMSLAPIDFNTNLQNGILASYNSFISDNVGNGTNDNMQKEYASNSSFSSSNPAYTQSSTSSTTMPSVNFIANSTPPSLIAGYNLISNPSQNTAGQVMSQLVENNNANNTLQKAIYAGDVIPASKL